MIRVPEEYKYLTEYKTLKAIDEDSLGFYYLVVLAGLSIDGGAGMRITELHQLACEKGFCEDRWGKSITYRAILHDIRTSIKKAGLDDSPYKYYCKVMKEYYDSLKAGINTTQ